MPKKATKKVINELISDYKYNTKQFHILFIAKNQIGWNNLVKLQSEAARICEFNARYCCDDNLIFMRIAVLIFIRQLSFQNIR